MLAYKSYRELVDQLVTSCNQDEAYQRAVGGEFEAVGKLEHFLLRSLGLANGQHVVDVGCGSGRLAVQLCAYPGLSYTGCDIEPRLLGYARSLTRRSDWNFVETKGAGVPCADGAADWVCFFSVFTHLSHEESFRYLEDARRALKPGGAVVLSFLEFQIPCHWTVFAASIGTHDSNHPLNQFISRDAIKAWAQHTGLVVEQIWDGDKPHIPLPEPVEWENGTRVEQLGCLGQSVAVLRKPATS